MSEIELGIGGPRPPLDVCLDNLKRVVELAEQAKIILALENHMDFRIADFRYFFEHIDSPHLRINLDTGNLLPLQEDVISFAEEFADKIVSCHFKGVRYIWRDYGAILTSCLPEESIIDLGKIIEILIQQPRTIPLHIEIVAMNSGDEDSLLAAHAIFLKKLLQA